MDLFKAHDCLPHDLLTAEREAHGISKSGLNLSYYRANYQIENSEQWSTLGSLFFNLFINDLSVFLERTNVCNFADDNTIYKCDIDLEIKIWKTCNITWQFYQTGLKFIRSNLILKKFNLSFLVRAQDYLSYLI